LIEGVGFSTLRHDFKMTAMTSYHIEKYCYLVIAHAASDRCICSSVRCVIFFAKK